MSDSDEYVYDSEEDVEWVQFLRLPHTSIAQYPFPGMTQMQLEVWQAKRMKTMS